jgi:hypothetical protein
MKKRTIEKGNGSQQVKRGRNLGQQSRSHPRNTYLQQPTPATVGSSSGVSSPPSSMSMPYKGARKGKGKGTTKGKRQDNSSGSTPLYGKGFSRGKGPSKRKDF